MDFILPPPSESFTGAIAMSVTFNSLPEAQAYATEHGVTKYWRVHFTDTDTREMRALRARLGAWAQTSYPAYRIYMDLADAVACIATRAAGTQERTEIETLWTKDVSASQMAQ